MAGINTDNFRLLRVGVIGATGLVGRCLLPVLAEEGYDVVAFSGLMRKNGVCFCQYFMNNFPFEGFINSTMHSYQFF